MTTDVKEIWAKALALLQDKIPEASFNTWFKTLVPSSMDGDKLVLLTPLGFTVHTIKMSYKDIVNKALSDVTGVSTVFEVVHDKSLEDEYEKENRKIKAMEKELAKKRNKEDSKYDGLKQMQSSCKLNLKYTFKNFVVGEYNKLAYYAALSTAQGKDKGKYNPLFVYGGSGLGKTHLLHAIGHYVLFNRPGVKVKYITSEEFLNDLTNSLYMGLDKNFSGKKDKNKTMATFREKYRNQDILLIDDIQFVAGKERMQLEIFNIFDTLHREGKQIVLTSDRLPGEIPGLTDRLKTRFEWGLTVDIGVPDLETRMAILKKLSVEDGLELSTEVTEFLAKIYKSNIRELEGAFNRVSANCSFAGISNPDLATVKKFINYSDNKKVITVPFILEKVGAYYNVPVSEIIGQSRQQKTALARKVAIYFARELTDNSYVSIGEQVGGRKHTTVMVSCDGVKDMMKKSFEFEKEIDTLRGILNNS